MRAKTAVAVGWDHPTEVLLSLFRSEISVCLLYRIYSARESRADLNLSDILRPVDRQDRFSILRTGNH